MKCCPRMKLAVKVYDFPDPNTKNFDYYLSLSENNPDQIFFCLHCGTLPGNLCWAPGRFLPVKFLE